MEVSALPPHLHHPTYGVINRDWAPRLAPSAPGSWAAALPPAAAAAAAGRCLFSDRFSACTHIGLGPPAHLLHHPAAVPLSLGPIGAGSASTATRYQHCVTDACHVPRHPLVVSAPHGEESNSVELLGPPTDAPAVDTAEQVYISSLALLKMLKHGRAGVPMEVMGLMLGEFVDDYTVRVIDVFAMPQSGTGVSVEAVDPVFQAKMLDMLKQTGRPEMVVGWYHSHPGFGCWLSGVDINTQQSFEALSERAVAVVVDPIQSVKGKVVIDAFRLINANMMVLGHEPRQTTSNLGHLNKPSIQALIHGLNRHYYSITINYRKNELEQKMLLNLHKKSWMEGLTLQDYSEHCKHNESVVKEMLELAKNYNKAVEEEDKMTPEQLAIKNVGKQDPKRHLEEHVDVLMTSNIVQCLAAMLDTVVFK
ncbi:26S proteasome non-ATPase regulatory subunit 14 [Myotis davidii]|nr:26S proteasome non-ATPase regulatory subunit 14 [Myotis davidii]